MSNIYCYHMNNYAEYDADYYQHQYGKDWCLVNLARVLTEWSGNFAKLITEINSKGKHVGIIILTNSQLDMWARKLLNKTNIMDFVHYQKGPIQNMGYLSQGPQLNLYVFNFPEGNKVVLK